MISRDVGGPNFARREPVRVAIGVWALVVSGCLYLDTVNRPPSAAIETLSVGTAYVQSEVTFSARRSEDDEPADLRYEWSAVSAGVEFAHGTALEFAVTIPGHDPVQVFLQVFDRHGARATATHDVVTVDRAPIVNVHAQSAMLPDGTYPLSKPITVAASGFDPDGDAVNWTVTLRAPPASDPNRVEFHAEDATSWTLVPDVAGRWDITVNATDGFGRSTVVTETLAVAVDQPPCIAVAAPEAVTDSRYLLDRTGGPRRFALASVSDDLDPYPDAEGHASFRWFVGSEAAPPEVYGHDRADFVFEPGDYLPGDRLALRVEVSDRLARTLPCAAEQLRCSIGGNSCLQRVSWLVEIR